ncbi:MAG: LuxR family transcriptional regulator [Alphaproteobacteria bacterium]|nr:LuxR family transcriptional regulator [Alphaproteobacteria bacterium]|tara:strand:- start:4363 stop:5148 length:786 start_codon:yes stop_codon:yes gene_type:complete
MLVDSHCHLDYDPLSAELDAVVDRARAAGIGTMLTISTQLDRFPGVLEIAERFDNIWCSVGVHPHEASREPELTAKRLIDLSKHSKVVGIGETGLDYYYEHSPRDLQQQSFRAHITAARETGLPVIVHSRNAEVDTTRILMDEYMMGPYPGLLHCFSATRQLAENALEIDLRISFSGIVTFKNADEVREAVRIVPLDRILVETDAPYLAPIPHRGKINEPSFVTHTAAAVAELKGMPQDALWEATTENFFELFRKAEKPQK